MVIKLYEDWMQSQVIKLFSNEYGRTEAELIEIHSKFYNHHFQKGKCIRIVSMDGDIVTGFQTLFYWPYQMNNKIYRSFQSGNSIVHPDYRGKGIFQKLLNFLDENNKELNIDFLMGFPVEASFGSFIRNKWTNPFNLHWYLKLVNPIAFLFSKKKLEKKFDSFPLLNTVNLSDNIFRLHVDESFLEWRNGFRDSINHFYFNYIDENNTITFGLKMNVRSRFFNELIVGEIRTTTNDINFIRAAFKKLVKSSRASYCVTVLTIALVENKESNILKAINSKGFIATKKQIYFITKSYGSNSVINIPKNWELYRGDIDSW